MSIFSRIFQWKPKHQVSAYRPVYAAFLDRLAREGVYTGGTGGYPRVEVHSVREGERLDKEGQLRQMTMTIESISTKSMTEAAMMNEENLELLTAQDLMLDDHWLCIGITPTQLQDLVETTDTQKILYRILQEVTVYAEKLKQDDTVFSYGNTRLVYGDRVNQYETLKG
jgi:hypothetical protein